MRAKPTTPGPSATPCGCCRPIDQANVLRAFGLYFQLVNIAEQHHRLRRRRQYAAEDQQAPRESLADAFERLRDIDASELRTRVSRLSLELVLTAHPTEATRRTYLLAHVRVAALLAALDAATSAQEEARIESELGEQITILWQTDEVRHGRPRLTDEIRHGLWFFEDNLPDAAERLLAEYRTHLPDAPSPLSFGTWIGGDMDGNPAAGAETIREALDRARELALARYRSDVRELAVALAMHRSLVEVSPELDESIARDELELPDYAGTIGRRSELEPYRRKLSFIWWRLGNDGYDSPDRAARGSGRAREQPRGQQGHTHRDRAPGSASTAGRDLRLPSRQARRAVPCRRAAGARCAACAMRWQPRPMQGDVMGRPRSTR